MIRIIQSRQNETINNKEIWKTHKYVKINNTFQSNQWVKEIIKKIRKYV